MPRFACMVPDCPRRRNAGRNPLPVCGYHRKLAMRQGIGPRTARYTAAQMRDRTRDYQRTYYLTVTRPKRQAAKERKNDIG